MPTTSRPSPLAMPARASPARLSGSPDLPGIAHRVTHRRLALGREAQREVDRARVLLGELVRLAKHRPVAPAVEVLLDDDRDRLVGLMVTPLDPDLLLDPFAACVDSNN